MMESNLEKSQILREIQNITGYKTSFTQLLNKLETMEAEKKLKSLVSLKEKITLSGEEEEKHFLQQKEQLKIWRENLIAEEKKLQDTENAINLSKRFSVLVNQLFDIIVDEVTETLSKDNEKLIEAEGKLNKENGISKEKDNLSDTSETGKVVDVIIERQDDENQILQNRDSNIESDEEHTTIQPTGDCLNDCKGEIMKLKGNDEINEEVVNKVPENNQLISDKNEESLNSFEVEATVKPEKDTDEIKNIALSEDLEETKETIQETASIGTACETENTTVEFEEDQIKNLKTDNISVVCTKIVKDIVVKLEEKTKSLELQHSQNRNQKTKLISVICKAENAVINPVEEAVPVQLHENQLKNEEKEKLSVVCETEEALVSFKRKDEPSELKDSPMKIQEKVSNSVASKAESAVIKIGATEKMKLLKTIKKTKNFVVDETDANQVIAELKKETGPVQPDVCPIVIGEMLSNFDNSQEKLSEIKKETEFKEFQPSDVNGNLNQTEGIKVEQVIKQAEAVIKIEDLENNQQFDEKITKDDKNSFNKADQTENPAATEDEISEDSSDDEQILSELNSLKTDVDEASADLSHASSIVETELSKKRNNDEYIENKAKILKEEVVEFENLEKPIESVLQSDDYKKVEKITEELIKCTTKEKASQEETKEEDSKP